MQVGIPVDGGSIGALYEPSTGPPSPALVVMTPIFGIEESMREAARHYATRGYNVIVPDLFWRSIAGPLPRAGAGRTLAMERKKNTDVALLSRDVAQVARYARALPECNGKVGAVGFCFGGRYAFLAAMSGAVDAAAAFHPTEIGESLDDAACAPLSLHFGGQDELVPMSEVEAIRAALAGCESAKIYVYPSARHSFAVDGADGYDERTAQLAEERAFADLDRLKDG